jgi:hypothetical protein
MISMSANVALAEGQFVAELSDGHEFRYGDEHNLAQALVTAGVPSGALSFRWRAGMCMLTAGKQVALCAEMRRFEQGADKPTRAW